MRINLSLVISVLIAVLLVTAGFTFFKIAGEREQMKENLYNRLSSVSSEIDRTWPGQEAINKVRLQKVCDSISGRYGLAGLIIVFSNHKYFMSGDVFATGKGIPGINQKTSFPEKKTGSFLKAGNKYLYRLSVPSANASGSIKALILFSDASDIMKSIEFIWIKDFIRWSLQLIIMLLATFLLVRWGIFKPINRIVNWIKALKDGKTDILHERSSPGFLAPLKKEVENIAFAMQEAKEIAMEEARLRTANEAIWTPDRLREEVKRILPDKTMVVVSNREPYEHIRDGKEIKCIIPASGMVTALEPILKTCGGLWIATATGDADRLTVDIHDKIDVPPGENKYVLKRIWITQQEELHYYYGFSNEGLWPLCHLVHTRPIFREVDWKYYKKVNSKFASAVLEEIREINQPFILVQDYHFALLPGLIKKERPDSTVAIFWHIPWPNQEAFSICPWKNEILDGMLGADLIGFHTQYHCNNFLETVNNNLDSRIVWDSFSVRIGNRTTYVKSFPISIAFTPRDYHIHEEKSGSINELLSKFGIRAKYMGIGVERIDYTKGIVERFHAVEHFLDTNPDFVGKFTFVQIGSPSRTMLKSYSDTIAMVESEAARINQKFRAKDWTAILLLMRHHSRQEIAPFYKAANFCMVTSLHDGMNLVAKEFVASRSDNSGVLILSRFAGASHELNGALVVNPYNISEMAEAIKTAIEMPEKSQNLRMQRMRNYIMEHNIFLWAAALLRTMVSIQN